VCVIAHTYNLSLGSDIYRSAGGAHIFI
jgi:hypothetical protein